MPFKIGDRVVHPHHGVGSITNLANKQFGPGPLRAYYEISMSTATLWVPIDDPSLGLRKLTVQSELERCRLILEGTPSTLDLAPRQLRDQLAKHLRDGTISAQCEVVRDLTALGWHKPLYGPMAELRRMALAVLCQEWSIVAGVSLVEATNRINAFLGKAKQAYGT